MHRYREEQLLDRPPLVPTRLRPENVYSNAELEFLAGFLKATIPCRSKEGFEAAEKKFSESERAKISRMLKQLRDVGYYPSGINEHGGIVWGVVLKGDLQIKMEKSADHYEKRGLEVVDQQGLKKALALLVDRLNAGRVFQ